MWPRALSVLVSGERTLSHEPSKISRGSCSRSILYIAISLSGDRQYYYVACLRRLGIFRAGSLHVLVIPTTETREGVPFNLQLEQKLAE